MKSQLLRSSLILVIAFTLVLILQPGGWAASANTTTAPPEAVINFRPPQQPSAVQAALPYTLAVEAIASGGVDVNSLDPALDYESFGAHVIQQVYESLVTLDRDDASQVVPQLSTGWTTSSDGKTYTFTLPSGVHFQNGALLTAQDAAFSYWRGILIGDSCNTPQWTMNEALFNVDDVAQLVDPSGNSNCYPIGLRAQPAALLQAAYITVTQAITYDNSAGTVTFHLVRPWGSFLQTLAGPWGAVMNRAWLISNGPWNGSSSNWQNAYGTSAHSSPIATIMNGTGPYQLDHWTPLTEIVLKRNPNYWRQTPLWPDGPAGLAAIEQVRISEVADSAAAAAMLLNGSADIGGVSASDAMTLNNNVFMNYYQPDGLVGVPQYVTGTLRAYRNILFNNAQDAFFNYDITPGGTVNYIGSGALDGNGVPVEFFDDLHVRKGFSYAFNWAQYISDVYSGQAIQRRGPFIKGIVGYTDTQPVYFYSPTLALQEFTQAWDGQLISNGFAITLAYSTGNLGQQSLAQNLKAGIEALTNTFHVNVIGLNSTTYNADRVAKRLPLFRVGWIQYMPDPNNWAVPYFKTNWATRQNLPSDQMAIYAAKINACQALDLSNPAAATCWEDIQNTAYLSATDIFLAQSYGSQYTRGEVRGFYVNAYGFGQYFYALSKGPRPVFGSASPGVDSSITFTSTTGAVGVLWLPAGSVTQTEQIVIVPDTIAQFPPAGYQFGKLAFEVQAYLSGTLAAPQTFAPPITVTLYYNDASKGVLIENQLKLFWRNGSSWEDAACRPTGRDLVNNILQVPICHFSRFALGGVTNKVYLPLTLKFH